MSSIDTKRPRRSMRLAGPPVRACPVVDLPLELLERITAHLDYDDLYSLASTSKLFRKTYRLRAVLAKLERYALCFDNTLWQGELFCLSDAAPGHFGWSPFLLILNDDPLQIDGHEQALDVSAVAPSFERFRRTSPTENYLYIQQTRYEVWIRDEYFEDGQFGDDLDREKYLEWDEDLAGRLVRATPKLLETRFKCPECKGAGNIVVGTPEIAKRWPQLLGAGFMYEIPCPRCQITYESAVEIQEEMDAEIEAEYEAEMEAEFQRALEAGELSDSYYDYF